MTVLYLSAAYLLGSVSAGYFLVRWKEKKDIRRFGSRNIGATNVLRTSGWKMALPVAIFDILKGFLPVLLAFHFFPDRRIALLAGFLAVSGHCFPFYLRFKGGKGVATTVGVYLAAAWKPLLIILALFLLLVALKRYISLGSLAASAGFPLFALVLREDMEIVLLGIALMLVIFLKHRENIRRLLAGKESKLGDKSL